MRGMRIFRTQVRLRGFISPHMFLDGHPLRSNFQVARVGNPGERTWRMERHISLGWLQTYTSTESKWQRRVISLSKKDENSVPIMGESQCG